MSRARKPPAEGDAPPASKGEPKRTPAALGADGLPFVLHTGAPVAVLDATGEPVGKGARVRVRGRGAGTVRALYCPCQRGAIGVDLESGDHVYADGPDVVAVIA